MWIFLTNGRKIMMNGVLAVISRLCDDAEP